MEQKILIFLLFFLPFVVIPVLPLPFETPKVFVAEFAIELLILMRLYKDGFGAFASIARAGLYTVGGLFGLSILPIILAPTEGTLFGNVFRLQGVFLFWHLLALALFAPYALLDKRFPLFAFTALIMLWVSTLVFGSTINARVVGSLGEPNALAAEAALLWAFVAVSGNKKSIAIATGVTLLIIALSYSHSGFIAFLIEASFLFLASFFKRSYGKAVVVGFVLIAVSFLLPFLEQKRGWYENRSEIWETAVSAGLQSPLIGHGFGGVTDALQQESWRIGNNIQYQYVDSSHNFLLDMWIQGGVVGLGLLLVLLWMALGNYIRHRHTLEITLLLGLITVMSFNPVSITSLVLFWWVIGRGFRIRT